MHKRAQEEIVGFVLVVVIISVILLVFLGIILKNTSQEDELETIKISKFLDAMMEVTTDCIITEPVPATFSELITACAKGKTCLNSGQHACEQMKENAEKIIESSWRIKRGAAYDGYIFEVKTPFETKISQNIFSPCKNTEKRTVEWPLPLANVTLTICENLN